MFDNISFTKRIILALLSLLLQSPKPATWVFCVIMAIAYKNNLAPVVFSSAILAWSNAIKDKGQQQLDDLLTADVEYPSED